MMRERLNVMEPSYDPHSDTLAIAVPPHTLQSLLDYVGVSHGRRIPTGGFLEAVLSNDLFGAIGRADTENSQAIHAICTFVYNRLPSGSWGSPERYRNWLSEKAA